MIPGPRQESQDVSPGGLALSEARVIFIPGAWQNPLDYETIVTQLVAADTGLVVETLDLPSSRPKSEEIDDLTVLTKSILKESTPAHLVAVSRGGALAVRASYEATLSPHISGITLVNVGGPPVLPQQQWPSAQEDLRHTPLFYEGIVDLQNGWTSYAPDVGKEVFYNRTDTVLQQEITGRMRPQRTPRIEEIPLAPIPLTIPVDVVCARDDRVYNYEPARVRRQVWLGNRPVNEVIMDGDHSLHVSNYQALTPHVLRSVHKALEHRKYSRKQ